MHCPIKIAGTSCAYVVQKNSIKNLKNDTEED
jgi:hypothetical protein